MEIAFARESVLVSAKFLTAQGNGLVQNSNGGNERLLPSQASTIYRGGAPAEKHQPQLGLISARRNWAIPECRTANKTDFRSGKEYKCRKSS